MFKDTGGNDAASILLNLTDYRVIDATQEPAGRQVLIEPKATEAACRIALEGTSVLASGYRCSANTVLPVTFR